MGRQSIDVFKMEQLIHFHRVNVKVGLACALLSCILIYCLLTNNNFKRRQRLIITLAFADLANCIAILMMGMDRINLYTNVLKTRSMSTTETSWTCALEPWLFVRTIGDLWPPIVQCLMGTEQLMTAISGFRSRHRSDVLMIISAIFVVAVLTLGYITAFHTRNDGFVMYYCGRKAAFGKLYSGCVYAHNVFGYVSGVVLNSLAVQRMSSQKPSDDALENRRRHDQLVQTRSCLLVSCISTVLVSLPNCLSLFSLLISSVKDSISKPAVWATCINSGINLFVYFALNNEFRQHCGWILTKEDPLEYKATVKPLKVKKEKKEKTQLIIESPDI